MLIRLIFILVSLGVSILSSKSQNIKEFYIECNPGDFELIYENYLEDIYIPIVFTYQGISWTNVKMRIRGDGSREYPKKSLKVVFESEPFINGEQILNLNAEYKDKSYMHSYISSILFKKAGLDCVNMEHVRLHLNGDFLGLYLSIENLDEKFLIDRNYNPVGSLYKASKDGACLSVFDNVFYHWDLKSGNDPYMDDLAELINQINLTQDAVYPAIIVDNFVYDQLISFIALNMLISNGSTYYHNYYLFKEPGEDGKWHIFPWDLDLTLSSYSKWYLHSRSSGYWSADNPILERSIIDENMLFDISDKLLSYKNSFFDSLFIYPIIDSLENVLLNSVLEDTTDNITDLNTWYEKIELDKDFVDQRYNILTSQISNLPANFKVSRHIGYYYPGEQITLEWSESPDPTNTINYTLYYGKDVTFEDTTTVIISGLQENSYTINNLNQTGRYYWKVEAMNGTLTTLGFDSYNTLFIIDGVPEIVVNEINYKSGSGFDPEDWVELYNNEDTAVNLSGWYIKDNNNGHYFSFPTETMIDQHGYLVLCRDTAAFYSLFPDTINAIGNLDFGFSSNGELVRLYHPTKYLVDSLVYRIEFPWPQEPNGNGPTLELINPTIDNSYGGSWAPSIGNGTPGGPNSKYSPANYNDISGSLSNAKIIPNPVDVNANVVFDLTTKAKVTIKLLDMSARIIYTESHENQLPGEQAINLHLQNIIAGVYICQVYVDDFLFASELVIKK